MTDRPVQGSPEGDGDNPLFSLVSGEGDGFMLGLAAGDTAGGAWELGYSAITEQATLISYQLINERSLDRRAIVDAMRELDGAHGVERVFRAESPEFRAWLDLAAKGGASPIQDPTAENLVRASPIGAAFRRDVDALVENAVAVSKIFTSDATSIIVGVLGASAVAAAAFGQSGRDFLGGVAEAVIEATSELGHDVVGTEKLDSLEHRLHNAISSADTTIPEEATFDIGGYPNPLDVAMAGLVLAAPMLETPHEAIAAGARLGGSLLGGFVGAVVGARVGIRAWPWAFANDTWFAEIGRRVVRGPDETRDLPIPYAVEQHLMSGASPGLH